MNSEHDSNLVSNKHSMESLNSQSSSIDLEQFASDLFNDLQVPLSSISSFAELLANEYQDDLDEKALDYLKKLDDSGLEMQTLLEDLQTYSQAGTSQQTWLTVDLNLILHQVLNNLEDAIAFKKAEIVVGDLPSILTNPQEIHQVLENLIDNAIKFNQSNPLIEITAVKQEREWLITVADNGIGIPEESQLEIFQVFQRLNPIDAYSGSGIGLAICQKIVTRYGGKIWVESNIDRGSSFYFTVPINVCPPTQAIAV